MCDKLPPPMLLSYGMSHARITSPAAIFQWTNLDTQCHCYMARLVSEMAKIPEFGITFGITRDFISESKINQLDIRVILHCLLNYKYLRGYDTLMISNWII